jgi:formylglycine-generating enzyme required for sulfatase activity
MVLVPEGLFTLGTNDRDPWDIVAQPAQEITLPAYYIDKYEVSNDQYSRCVDAGRCSAPTKYGSKSRNSYYDDPQYADFPVIYVSWGNASAYCSWRGGRLPSEAEWEKAARSDDQRPFPWGEDLPDCLHANFWPTGACEGDTLSVKSNPSGASPYGAFNMSGNVAEWVHAWFAAYKGGNASASKDFGQSYRVIRGGTYFDNTNNIRTTVRKGLSLEAVQSYVGFRCVVDLANIP